jgi:ATP-dependent Clp protease ATP-binding subunit ClpC
VLEHAMETARVLNHSYLGTEHLLIGLLREEKCIAAHVLNSLGISLAAAHTSMLRLTGDAATPADEAG